MGNNLALDESTEARAQLLSQEIDYESPDEFIREVLTRIGAGRYRYEPQPRDLNMLKAAVSITARRMLSESLQAEDDIASSYKSRKIDNAAGYKKLLASNTHLYLKSINGQTEDKTINMLDSDRIQKRLVQGSESNVLYLPVERVQINLTTMVAVSDIDPKDQYMLYNWSTDAIAEFSIYAKSTSPTSPIQIRSSKNSLKNPKYALKYGNFAQFYCQEVKKTQSLIDSKGFTNMLEIIRGLWTFYCERLEQKIEGSPFGDALKQMHREAFEIMILCMGLPNLEKPLSQKELQNPKSQVVQAILYLFSCEPSFEEEFCEACMIMDKDSLRHFGPLARGLFPILKGGQTEHLRKDRLKCGFNDKFDKKVLGFYSQCFLVYKGTLMRPDQLKMWQKQVSNKNQTSSPEPTCLHGVTVVTSVLKNALLSTQSRDIKKQPVLFVFLLQNYKKFGGFRLNTEVFAMDPSKGEIVLHEGCPVYTLKIEKLTIENQGPSFEQLNGQSITVIYMYHQM